MALAYVYHKMISYAQFEIDVSIDEEANALDFMDDGAAAEHLAVHIIILLLATRPALVLDHEGYSYVIVHEAT